MNATETKRPYARPRLRSYGRMDTVTTQKSFIKGGTKNDPMTPMRNRVN